VYWFSVCSVAACIMASPFIFLTFLYWSKIIRYSMMDMSIGEEDWALACSWPPSGDQWHYSVDQFFEPVDLVGNKFGEAECQLLSDGVIVQNNSFSSLWSNGASRMSTALLMFCAHSQYMFVLLSPQSLACVLPAFAVHSGALCR